MVAKPTRRLFTVREYYKMDKVGILKPDERTELIEGVIIQMPSIGVPHASQVNRMMYVFIRAVGDRAQVIIQNALALTQRSEPQPDVMLVRPKSDFYSSGHPTPADVFLVVEVSDTSLPYDRRIKLPLYAREGVPELWILNVREGSIGVHREPGPRGYAISFTVRRGDRIAVAGLPDIEFAVDDLLGELPSA